jgi:GT2 family glycosyltransferase
MLASLSRSIPEDLDYEIILVDDGSTDGTRDWLTSLKHQRIRPIFNDHNIGYAKSNNRAVGLAAGRILALLNNDLILRDGWLEPMLDVLCSPSTNAGLVGNIQFRAADDSVDHAGVEVTYLSKIEHIRILPPGPPRPFRRIFAVTGACCLIRRTDFLAVGGFDEQYVNGGEDIDLCLKIKALHKYVYVADASRIKHHVSLTRCGAAESRERNERNSRLLFQKWRAVIEQETKNAWMTLLSSVNEDNSLQIIHDFSLMETFTAAPHAVSGILAKSACLREDTRWREILDGDVSLGARWGAASVRGFRWDSTSRYPWIDNRALFILPRDSATRNVAITGAPLPGGRSARHCMEDIVITMQINGVQERSWRNIPAKNFSLGIGRPASVPLHHTLVAIAIRRVRDGIAIRPAAA